jgi:hypothetical protein
MPLVGLGEKASTPVGQINQRKPHGKGWRLLAALTYSPRLSPQRQSASSTRHFPYGLSLEPIQTRNRRARKRARKGKKAGQESGTRSLRGRQRRQALGVQGVFNNHCGSSNANVLKSPHAALRPGLSSSKSGVRSFTIESYPRVTCWLSFLAAEHKSRGPARDDVTPLPAIPCGFAPAARGSRGGARLPAP